MQSFNQVRERMYKCNNCSYRTDHKHVLKTHVEHEKKKKEAGKLLSDEFLKYCRENNLEKVTDCLARGVDVNTVSVDGCWTALTIACYEGYPELLTILLAQPGIDVNKTVKVPPEYLHLLGGADGAGQGDGGAVN